MRGVGIGMVHQTTQKSRSQGDGDVMFGLGPLRRYVSQSQLFSSGGADTSDRTWEVYCLQTGIQAIAGMIDTAS